MFFAHVVKDPTYDHHIRDTWNIHQECHLSCAFVWCCQCSTTPSSTCATVASLLQAFFIWSRTGVCMFLGLMKSVWSERRSARRWCSMVCVCPIWGSSMHMHDRKGQHHCCWSECSMLSFNVVKSCCCWTVASGAHAWKHACGRVMAVANAWISACCSRTSHKCLCCLMAAQKQCVMPRHQNDVRHFHASFAKAQTQTSARVSQRATHPTHTIFSSEVKFSLHLFLLSAHLPQTLHLVEILLHHPQTREDI